VVTSPVFRNFRSVTRTGSRTTWRSGARDAPGFSHAVKGLGKRIKELRETAELTQEEAAEAARLDVKHWQDVENARTNPTVATLVGIARALDVELAELFQKRAKYERR
jgi:DNA-binding XRE family transcriptional regulator